MNYNRSLMKENAKAAMTLANPRTWLVTLVFLLLLAVVPGVITAAVPNPVGEYIGALVGTAMENGNFDNAEAEELVLGIVGALGVSAILSMGVSILLALFRALMDYGYRGYALEVYRREPTAGVGSLFKGFPKFGPVVGSAILVGLFSFLWGLLLYGVAAIITFLVILLCEEPSAWIVVGLLGLLFAAGFFHSILVYRYCLTPYFVMGRDGVRASDAVNASVRAMKGNLFKRFVLELSFLGWKILLKLIVFTVFLCGTVVAVFISGGSLLSLIDLAERIEYMGPEGVGQFVMALLGVAVPFLVVAAVTALVQLPLNLWLTSYRNVSYAGFFQEIAGAVPQASAMTPPPYVPSGFNNVPPTVPPSVPKVPPVPTAVPYTPFGSQAGAAPYVPFGVDTEETQLMEEPQAPAAPASFAPEAPQAPAAPVSFAPEEPQVPVAPADPEPVDPEN